MQLKKSFLKGTIILTFTGFLSKIIGFFYRIFLSQTIGAEGLGIYQLIFPVQGLLLAVTTAGMQTTLSRFIASQFAQKNPKRANDGFVLGCTFSLLFSIGLSCLVYNQADFISVQLLAEPRTAPLLRLLAFAIPLSSLHSCVNSYHYGQKKTGAPSVILLLEQTFRVFTAFLVYQIALSKGFSPTPLIAVAGILAGELAAALSSLLVMSWNFQTHRYRIFSIAHPGEIFSDLLHMSVPLTLNRVLLTLLSSIEVILIPRQLIKFGLSSSEALSLYGIFTGMTLPLILFPSAITNSASVMLLPSIAEIQALGYRRTLQRTITKAVQSCLLLGAGCGIFFFLSGNFLGLFLFDNSTAGTFIRIMAFICPFLYTNTALSSILNGLGKPSACLVHNVTSISIRIFFVAFFIPVFGIRGYLWGILLGELLLTFLHGFTLYRLFKDTLVKKGGSIL